MSAVVTLTSEVRTQDGTGLRDLLLDWLPNIPSAAAIDPLLRECGSQRDPYTVLVGLRATWQEQR